MRAHLNVLAVLALWVPAMAMSATTSPASTESGSALTLPMADVGASDAYQGDYERSPSVFQNAVATRYESIRYRPRGERRPRYSRRGYSTPVVSQLHAGFFDPGGEPSRGFLFGFRGGPLIDPHVQLGVSVDWEHKSDRTSEVLGSGTLPDGTPVTVTDERLRARTDFVPLLAFIQVGGDDRMPIAPYAGLGGGYEMWSIEADTDQGHFEGNYGGWGWQIWGGAAVPLSGQSRLFGEVFYNQAELGRDVEDPLFPGRELRETVNLDGSGMRFGLSWGF